MLFPGMDNLPITSVLAAIGDHRASLAEIEQESVANAVPKRQREFAAGRVFARAAMAHLGLPPTAIPALDNRAPQWPAAMLGSISHSDTLAWVVGALRSSQLQGLGADIERLRRVQPALYPKLFTETEQERLQALAAEQPGTFSVERAPLNQSEREQQLATLWFSGKEAVYKATAPIAGAFIGFQEVELVPSIDGLRFSMRYLGSHEPSAVMEQGRGYFCLRDDHALALFTIPSAP